MLKFMLKRLALLPVILWAIYTITFIMVVLVPGNPFQTGERSQDDAASRAIMIQYKADDNLSFYFSYMGNLFHPINAIMGEGPLIDLGPSWKYRDWTCNQIISASLPVSVSLGLMAMLIACLVGIPAGVVSAVRRGSLVDFSTLGLSLIGISLPSFVVGISLLIVFAMWLHWFPVGGWGGISQIWLPAVTLSLPFMAYIARLTRLGMMDVLESDYIRTARAKGLSDSQVIWKHALKNAFLPVLSYLGPALAAAMTGSFVVETIYNIPGIGQHFVSSVENRDRAMILATVLMFSAVIIIFNLIVDMAYSLVDARIELE